MISTIDIGIIVAYLLVVLLIGFFLGRKEKADGFFVNNRKTGVFLLLFTTLTTQVGSGTFIGIASASYTSGISFGLTFGIAILLGWIFAIWLVPRVKEWGDKTNGYTLGDFFRARYSSRTQIIASSGIVVVYLLITAIQFLAFSGLLKTLFDISHFNALLIGAIVTIAYTAFAGIKGDFYTDAIQFFVMLPVFFFLFIAVSPDIQLSSILSGLPEGYLGAFNYAGPSFFFGALIFGIPILLMQMEIWQRIYAAKDSATARKAFAIGGALNILIIIASIAIGLIAFHLIPGRDGDQIIFELMESRLPSGLLGIGFAGVLALLMSTIDSMLMVGSATLTKDFYMRLKPKISEQTVLKVGRSFIVVFGVLGAFFALFFESITGLLILTAQILIVFAPAIVGGLLWKRANEKAAFWSILSGFLVTFLVLPFDKDTAFIPALIVAIIIFITISLRSTKSQVAPTS